MRSKTTQPAPSAEQRDLNMMKSPDNWPRWPLLPIKRSKGPGFPQCASLFADGKPTVILTNLWALEDLPGSTYGEKFANVEKIEYPSFDALVTDGWRVD